MVADEAGWEVDTRQCETAAGIGFGVGVSQGTGDNGAIVGGSAFVGITVRDITQDGAPLDVNSATRAPVDTYPQYANMGVLNRGHIWVEAQSNVTAGTALFYDTTSGKFAGSASGSAARGYIDFTQIPAADQTIVINAKTWTFRRAVLPACRAMWVRHSPTPLPIWQRR
jgi:hypothetical protein